MREVTIVQINMPEAFFYHGKTYNMNDIFSEMYSDEEEDEDCDEEEQDDFVDLPPGVTRVVTTVPAKEPRLDAQPLKPALKQPKGSSRSQAGTPPSQNGRHHAPTPPQDKHQNSR